MTGINTHNSITKEYDIFLTQFTNNAQQIIKQTYGLNEIKILSIKNPIFVADTNIDLWSVFINSFPKEVRQFYNCRCCKNFVEKYGKLVIVDENGIGKSLLWNQIPNNETISPVFEAMTKALYGNLKYIKINHIFISKGILGIPYSYNVKENCNNSHMCLGIQNIESCSISKQNSKQQYKILEIIKTNFNTITSIVSKVNEENIEVLLDILKNNFEELSKSIIPEIEYLHKAVKIQHGSKDKILKHNLLWLLTIELWSKKYSPKDTIWWSFLELLDEPGVPMDIVKEIFEIRLTKNKTIS